MKFRIMAALLALFLLIATLPTLAADNTVDLKAPTSLTISYRENGEAIAGARFDLFCVALLKEKDGYVLSEDYSGVPVDLSDLSQEKLQSLSETVNVYTQLYKIPPVYSAVTDEEGTAVFSQLIAGLYLVSGQDFSRGGVRYSSKPFLVFLPAYDSASGEWIYDVTAVPKGESEPDCPDCETVSRKVLKIWCDGKSPNRPRSITVYLLRDGEVYDTVVLNAENNWRYSWDKLSAKHKWTVAEDVPEGYTVSISLEGITYVILNTGNNPPPPPDTTPPCTNTTTPPPDLPQTGQLWWPVPILLIIGIFFVTMGIINRRSVYYND
ncbi:MAG: Cna B-type domain-containing protein [Clostridia bacterium]|nr:Cna B-type domain-containing protein [Clostridia bacterium]